MHEILWSFPLKRDFWFFLYSLVIILSEKTIAEIQLLKAKPNLPHNERKAIKDLKSNHDINIKKTDKGTTTVIMSRHDKIKEGQIQLDNLDNYRPLEQPMERKQNK